MSNVIPLAHFPDFSGKELQSLIDSAGRAISLRVAIERVIRAIHGLPDILDADLRKIEVYIGRAAATVPQLRNRWKTRMDDWGNPPSAHAMVVTVTPTDRLREQRWERAAQLIVNRLVDNKALCCSNALLGQSGKWPEAEDSLIYVVARKRKGPSGSPATATQIKAAVADLVLAANKEAFPPDVVIAAGTRIQHRDDKDDHALQYPARWTQTEETEEWETQVCKTEHCSFAALAGNFGYCGIHRPKLGPDQTACKSCARAALPGNYGYCGIHRAFTPPGYVACKTCGRSALQGNYGFCGIHRK